MLDLATVIQEIFDEPNFQSQGSLCDFTLKRGFNTHLIRIISRDLDYKVIEVLHKSSEIGEIKRTNYFKTLEELALHLRNVRKGYHTFEFSPQF